MEFAKYAQEVGTDVLMVRPAHWTESCTPRAFANHYKSCAEHISMMVVTNVFVAAPMTTEIETLKRLHEEVPGVIAAKDDIAEGLGRRISTLFHDHWIIIGGGTKDRTKQRLEIVVPMTINLPELESNLLWSATPTPFDQNMEVDVESAHRLVDHHIKLGVSGLFLLGTCGEGPWVPNDLRRKFVREVTDYSNGRLTIAVQVTDNSAARILENIEMVREEGGDLAVVAAPYFVHRPTPAKLGKLYREVVEQSSLPIGIYDLGEHGPIAVPFGVLEKIVADEKVVVVKDSSTDVTRQASYLAVRESRNSLRLVSGNEWDCVSYLQAGYDGLLLGGGIFNGYIARQIMEAVAAGDIDRARQLQDRMNEMMWAVYGGKDLTCWLRGLKHLLVEMGIFETENLFLDYPLTDECRRDIAHVLQEYRDILLPWEGN